LLLAIIALAAGAPVTLGAQASAIVLVRHAEKSSDTKDPDLTPAGVARADALRDALAQYSLQGIFVSEFQRTMQTALPIAKVNHLTPTVVAIQGDKLAQATATAAALRGMAPGSAALVVGHSNTIGLLIAAIGGPAVPALCDDEHATLFVLELSNLLPPRLLQAKYGAPDPAGALACHDEPLPE
jgi:broad specificity phosphatase PhoE